MAEGFTALGEGNENPDKRTDKTKRLGEGGILNGLREEQKSKLNPNWQVKMQQLLQ